MTSDPLRPQQESLQIQEFEVFHLHIRFLFAYPARMFLPPSLPVYDFIVECKGCRENIPAPVQTMPGTWIIAECPLCHEKRRYLPVEISRGRLSHKVRPEHLRFMRV